MSSNRFRETGGRYSPDNHDYTYRSSAEVISLPSRVYAWLHLDSSPQLGEVLARFAKPSVREHMGATALSLYSARHIHVERNSSQLDTYLAKLSNSPVVKDHSFFVKNDALAANQNEEGGLSVAIKLGVEDEYRRRIFALPFFDPTTESPRELVVGHVFSADDALEATDEVEEARQEVLRAFQARHPSSRSGYASIFFSARNLRLSTRVVPDKT